MKQNQVSKMKTINIIGLLVYGFGFVSLVMAGTVGANKGGSFTSQVPEYYETQPSASTGKSSDNEGNKKQNELRKSINKDIPKISQPQNAESENGVLKREPVVIYQSQNINSIDKYYSLIRRSIQNQERSQ